MKNLGHLEKLEKKQQKEMELAKQHEQNCNDLRKQIELQRGNMIQKNINRLNLNADEFHKLMRLLADKKTLLEAVELVKPQPEELNDSVDNMADEMNEKTKDEIRKGEDEVERGL